MPAAEASYRSSRNRERAQVCAHQKLKSVLPQAATLISPILNFQSKAIQVRLPVIPGVLTA